MTGLVLLQFSILFYWLISSSHYFWFHNGKRWFLVARLVLENSTLTIQFFCDVSTSGSGGEGVKILEKKNKTTNQDPKLNYLGGLIGSKSLLKKWRPTQYSFPPHPTPFREGGHRKKVLSGFKKVNAGWVNLGGFGRVGGWLFLKLCGDGPSATDFKSHAAWAGGVGKIGGKGQKTQVVGLVAAVFPFPPLRILSRV